MTKQEAIEAAKNLFVCYPKTSAFYFTADGQAFEKKGDAEAHASFLDKAAPVVVSVSRDQKVEEVEKVEVVEEVEKVEVVEEVEKVEVVEDVEKVKKVVKKKK